MPSKIDIVTRNRTIYDSTSPPTVDVGLFVIAKTGVNLKAAGTTAVFTVPTGRVFLCTGYAVRVTAVDTGGAGTQNLAIQESSANRVMFNANVSGSATPVAGQTTYYSVPIIGNEPFSTCAAGSNVNVVVSTSHAGSTGVTGTVYVHGYYVS